MNGLSTPKMDLTSILLGEADVSEEVEAIVVELARAVVAAEKREKRAIKELLALVDAMIERAHQGLRNQGPTPLERGEAAGYARAVDALNHAVYWTIWGMRRRE